MKHNTIPCTQESFDVLMLALHKMGQRVSLLEDQLRDRIGLSEVGPLTDNPFRL